ncbi:MAG: hypothetical protein ACJ77N_05375, partial [Chloroflexota bacterium]
MASDAVPRFPRIPDDPLTRRELLRRAGALGLLAVGGPSVLLAACTPSAGAAPAAGGSAGAAAGGTGTLTFASYGGAYQDAQTTAWIDPYMKATGIKIAQDQPTDYAKIQAMVQAGNVSWDIVDVGNDFGLERNKDILEPIDCNIVPC